MLLVMDSKSFIKLNAKGNWSRVGLERPVELLHEAWVAGSNGVHTQGQLVAWIAQFYDSENNAYSGTIPVYKDEEQGIVPVTPSYSEGLKSIDIRVRTAKEYNIDRCLIWRTADMADTGTASDLYIAQNTNIPQMPEDWVTHRDIWSVVEIVKQDFLSGLFWGQSLIAKPCKAMALGYNRVFLFNSADERSSLYWSDTGALSFARPDHFPETYRMIVEEGDTTEGTALIEFSNQLFAFKENAIFLIEQDGGASFSNHLIYKGVGAVNQRSVTVAGNAIVFIDRAGIYQYAGGEPTMLSVELSDFFKDSVDQDTILDKAFILFDKTDDMVYAFLPSTDAPHCDRVVVYDARNKTFSIDLIPYVTCGYVDDDDIYVGTPYGQVLKVSKTAYLDGVTTSYTGTGTIL
jgi:hypothetical protein